jgi:hypothetical protein
MSAATTATAQTTMNKTNLRTNAHAFEQCKLTRREWEGLEVPLPPQEQAILKMIASGWTDVDVCTNPRLSLLSTTKLGSLSDPHSFIFTEFLRAPLSNLASRYPFIVIPAELCEQSVSATMGNRRRPKGPKISGADKIRLANINYENLKKNRSIWEFAIIDYISALCQSSSPGPVAFYTLQKAREARVNNTNPYLITIVDQVLTHFTSLIPVDEMVALVEEASELNPELQTFANRVLYKHQRDLITSLKRPGSKLIMYQAPTGTGKTLSPIAVSEGYKTIFVCASKHVGMQLARACISIHKRIAVAFGCQDPGDIRLHYFAVSECIRKRRSGAIGKVDHSQGQKADIIICDATSYLSAMHYMLSWNEKENMLVYWDEPTIAMDKVKDPLHDIVRRSWVENIIPNIVLSSATLPPAEDLPAFIEQTQRKFAIEPGNIIDISNYECARTVPIFAKSGDVTMPHNTAESIADLRTMVDQCRLRSTLLRHIDLGCAARYLLATGSANKSGFNTPTDVNPEAVKRAYLQCLEDLCDDGATIEDIRSIWREPKRYNGGVAIATTDASSITHGPALYLANDTEKVAKFLIKNANPSPKIIETLQERVNTNADVIEAIKKLEKDFDDRRGKYADNDDQEAEEQHAHQIVEKLANMREKLSDLRLPDSEVPNTEAHQKRFHEHVSKDAFAGSVPPHHLMEVLELDVANWKKMLLMMGIGVFGEECVPYKELMARMASERELFCVIAGTDYVYGTNYQFCHGYIGKDLADMPIEKMYQALGRVGRGRQAGQYSWRLRDDSLAAKIFKPDTRLTEARRMDRLMSGRA